MDDEYEAATFINDNVNHASAFVMNVGEGEQEQDCSALSGSNSIYEFR